MSDKLKSRKFWFALLGALLPIIAQYLSAEVDMNSAIQLSVGIIVAYIFGQGYVDGKAVEGSIPSESDHEAEAE